MKKIIAFLILLLCLKQSYAQYPLKQYLGSDSTLVTVRGGMNARLVLWSFTDTTQANTQRISQYAGALIYTTGTDKVWYRNSTATGWIEFTSSGGTTTNIYNSDGFITGTRVLDLSASPLTFSRSGVKQFAAEDNLTTIGSPNNQKRITVYNDSITILGLSQTTDTTTYKPLAIDADGYFTIMDRWPGSSTPTLQQVFSAEGNEAVITSSVDISPSTTGIDFLMGNNGVWDDIIMQSLNQFNLSSNAISLSAGNNNLLNIGSDSIKIGAYLGRLVIDTLNYTLSTTGKKILIRDTATGLVQNIDPSLLGGGSSSLSSITAATAVNNIDNGSYNQTWNWDEVASNDFGFSLNVNSNETNANGVKIAMSGNTPTGTDTSSALYVTNSRTGDVSEKSVGIYAKVTNGGEESIAINAVNSFNGYGVYSKTASGTGVHGTSNNGTGVTGVGTYHGVYGRSETGTGVYSYTYGANTIGFRSEMAGAGGNNRIGAYIAGTSNNDTLYGMVTQLGNEGGTVVGVKSAIVGNFGDESIAGYFSAGGSFANYAIIVPASSGSVGIGTSAPAKILHTVGTVRHATLGTASGDTTTNKPVGINSSGDIIPMTHWPGGGGSTSPAGNNRNIQFNSNGTFAGNDSLKFEGGALKLSNNTPLKIDGINVINYDNNTNVTYVGGSYITSHNATGYSVFGSSKASFDHTNGALTLGATIGDSLFTNNGSSHQVGNARFDARVNVAKASGYATNINGSLGANDFATKGYVDSTRSIESTYTPSLTNTTNIAASTAYTTYYQRVGDVVHVWGEVEIDATTALTLTELGMELPIASNITNSLELAGTAAHEDNTVAQVKGDPTNDRAKFRLTPQTNTANVYSFHFSYKYVAP